MWPEGSWIDARAVATVASREVTDPESEIFCESFLVASSRIEAVMATPPPGEGPPFEGEGEG